MEQKLSEAKFEWSGARSERWGGSLNKNIIDFIRSIKNENKNCHITIFSNATLLTEKISHEFIDTKLDLFEFSLDGYINEVVDKIRLGAFLSDIIDNVGLLNNIKKKKGAKFPIIAATTVLQQKNYRQLPQIVELAEKLGVTRLNVNGLEPYKEDFVNNVLWYPPDIPKDLPDILEETFDLTNEKKISLELSSFFPKKPFCYDINTPIILANGDVTTCGVLAYDRDYYYQVDKTNSVYKEKGVNKKKIFGNIYIENIKEIWFNQDYVEFRVNVIKGNFPYECKHCLIKHKFICVRSDLSPKSIIQNLKDISQNRDRDISR